MEEEIVIKDYLELLRRRWKVVLLLFLVTVVAAIAVTFFKPPVYEARVRLMEHSYTLFLTSQLESLDERPAQVIKMYSDHVKSRAVEQRVIERLESILSPAEKVPGVLRRRVQLATTDEDPAIFDIVVTASSPDKAEQIANAWAEEYVAWIKESSPDFRGEVELVSQLLNDAQGRLDAAEEALADFQRETGMEIVSKELEQKVLLLASHRVAQDNLSLLIKSAEEIKRGGGKVSDLPLQLLSAEAIANRGELSLERIIEQGEDIDAVIALLKVEEEIISHVAEALSTEVGDLEEELASHALQLERLERQRDAALEVYTAFSHKLEELTIRQATVGIVREAVVSEHTVGLGRTLSIGAGVLLGVFIGIGGAFLWDYLQGHGARGGGI